MVGICSFGCSKVGNLGASCTCDVEAVYIYDMDGKEDFETTGGERSDEKYAIRRLKEETPKEQFHRISCEIDAKEIKSVKRAGKRLLRKKQMRTIKSYCIRK
jgi:hypothetical protein